MAYVPTNQDDEEAKRREAAGTPPGSFGDTTPSSTPTHTNFVNVSDYLNKNPDASAHLGDLGAAKLDEQRNDATSSMNNTQSQFGQDVAAGGQKLDQGFLDNAFASPENFVKDPGNTAKFTALRDAAYTGPDSLQSTSYFAPTQDKISGLKTTAEGLGTEEGRNALVNTFSSHPTTGKTSLNQLLLQGSPDAAAKIEGAAGKFGGVEDAWQNFVNTSPNQVTQAVADTNAARTATRSQLGSADDAFTSGLQGKMKAAEQSREANNTQLGGLNTAFHDAPATLTDAQLAQAGITRQQYLNYQRVSDGIAGYNNGPAALAGGAPPIQFGNSAQTVFDNNLPTLGTVANSQDYAREAALEQLSGTDLGLDNTQAAQAGTYAASPGGIQYPWQNDYNRNLDALKALDQQRYDKGNYAAEGSPQDAYTFESTKGPNMNDPASQKIILQMLLRKLNGYDDPSKWDNGAPLVFGPPATGGGGVHTF